MDKIITPLLSHRSFNVMDYGITVTMLLLSTLIGIYFGFFSKNKPNTGIAYLIGDKKVGLFPVAMSLAASCIGSAIFLPISTDLYKNGTQLLVSIFSDSLSCLCMASIFIPVLYELNLLSSYEYFKLRFNSVVRTFSSFLFVIRMLAYLSVTNYGPCLTLSQVSGIDPKILIPCISAVVIFYTSIGGFRAVVWTDVLQMIMMITGIFSVMIIGVDRAGGLENIWNENEKGGRINFFQMKYNSSVRYTFWEVTIGNFFHYTGFLLVNQLMAQRCLSLTSYKKALIAIGAFSICMIMLFIAAAVTALAAYTVFRNCDPISSKIISRDDQIVPYFMMIITKNIIVIPGIYVSAIFSSSLSTVSTGLNSMAGVILIDFIRPIWNKPISDAKETYLMKIIVIIIGSILIAIMYVVDQLGDLFQTLIIFQSITSGALLGMFTMGMLFPWANSKGAFTGGAAAIAMVVWMSTGAQLHKTHYKLPLSIEGCDNTTLDNYYSYLNTTKIVTPLASSHQNEIFPLYKIHFFYYDLIAVMTVLIVGLTVSFLTGANNPKEMDRKLFPAIIRRFFKMEEKSAENLALMKTNPDRSRSQ